MTPAEMVEKVRSGEISKADIRSNGWMLSVTERIKKIKQPYGGYINTKEFTPTQLEGGSIEDLNPEENVSSGLVGTAVDYLTRFMTGSPAEDSFLISILGAREIGEMRLCESLLAKVKGLDTDSITAAVKLTGFDVCKRVGVERYRPVEGIEPDAPTIANIHTMVERSCNFFKEYGPKILDGLTFEGGYTGYVSTGDGDFLTKDTLWDFKVAKKKIQNTQTLQLLMYWRMGLHSIHPEYQKVKYLGLYNPRLNTIYRMAVEDIPADTIAQVEHDVIGYGA